MGNFLRLSNGVPRSFAEAGVVTIYDQGLDIVASSPGPNQIVGPINAGVAVTLPGSGNYTGSELEVYLNGDRIETVLDYSTAGSGPPYTQVQFTFQLVVGDRLRFRVDRTS